MILIYKPEGNDQRVNPNIKGMIAILIEYSQKLGQSGGVCENVLVDIDHIIHGKIILDPFRNRLQSLCVS